jgi:hypothetical protein
MAWSMPGNTTCDVYHAASPGPPAAPDVAAVPCRLSADFMRRMETGESETSQFRYTHILLADVNADIRDGFAAWSPATPADTVYVPDKNGTAFRVVHVEIANQGGAAAVRKVYLDRKLPAWPTSNL